MRFYESVIRPDGTHVRKKSFRVLAPVSKDYPNKTSVTSLADKILAPLNSGTLVPESSQRLIDFIDNHYLPEAKKVLRPSTYKGYKDIVEVHLRSRLGDVRVRDFRTVHGQRLMAQIPNVGHRTLLRIRATLSAVFTYALRTGVLEGFNPMHAVSVPGRPTKYKPPVYTIEESAKIGPALAHHDLAFVAVSIAMFSGLRVSEIRGLKWSDFDGNMLNIQRSVWRTHIGPTKTEESEAPVPVIPVLKHVLERYRNKINPKPDDYILAGERKGSPLNLNNLASRVIKPALKAAELPWKGWKAWRAGLASALYTMKIPPKVIAAILRHDPLTSWRYYIDTPNEESVTALATIEEWFLAVENSGNDE
ncbi:MAG: tyrosine-type recombinase/integrase [Candidatus Acidiferrum sp.]